MVVKILTLEEAKKFFEEERLVSLQLELDNILRHLKKRDFDLFNVKVKLIEIPKNQIKEKRKYTKTYLNKYIGNYSELLTKYRKKYQELNFDIDEDTRHSYRVYVNRKDRNDIPNSSTEYVITILEEFGTIEYGEIQEEYLREVKETNIRIMDYGIIEKDITIDQYDDDGIEKTNTIRKYLFVNENIFNMRIIVRGEQRTIYDFYQDECGYTERDEYVEEEITINFILFT